MEIFLNHFHQENHFRKDIWKVLTIRQQGNEGGV